ncbi:MAG TPA: trehalose-6-phosphate synthase [Steroidobacteraceae bacterium]|jgi:trehalose 6-phosphate synthase|nr:trehalose-6-phosphate synthase [Steroidobacteraceae bacterium]
MTTRVVCVSNRVAIPRRGSAPGGLAVGVLAALHQAGGGMWFGWGGDLSDEEPHEPEILIRDDVTYATIALRRRDFEGYYNGYANSTLWPLFHYLMRSFRYAERQHDAYRAVNRTFAAHLVPLLQPDDLIWVHDYHLIPLAECLRELAVTQPIGFFLHIPFPHIEMLRVLPAYAELLRELVAYDVVGFQTENDLRSFLAGIEYVWGRDAITADGRVTIGVRTIRTGVFPIGIDVAGVEAAATAAAQGDAVKRLSASLLGRKLMVGVDRLDYSKGLIERFAAYQTFLESYPENLGKITFMQVAPLSRTDVRAYAEIRQTLEQSAGRINGRFADADWTPIRYLNRNVPHSALMGFLRAAQVALVTPARDGMNLVAKEFVAAQDPADPGVLILSPLAGAARELSGAIQVNPYDAKGLAHAMQSALAMPLAERRDRHAGMMEVLRRNDVAAWHKRFLAALKAGPAVSKVGGTPGEHNPFQELALRRRI